MLVKGVVNWTMMVTRSFPSRIFYTFVYKTFHVLFCTLVMIYANDLYCSFCMYVYKIPFFFHEHCLLEGN